MSYPQDVDPSNLKYGVAAGAEIRRGPDQAQASHHQVKQVEQLLAELTHFCYKMHVSGMPTLGHSFSQIDDAAFRAANQQIIRRIFGIFGFADPNRTSTS